MQHDIRNNQREKGWITAVRVNMKQPYLLLYVSPDTLNKQLVKFLPESTTTPVLTNSILRKWALVFKSSLLAILQASFLKSML